MDKKSQVLKQTHINKNIISEKFRKVTKMSRARYIIPSNVLDNGAGEGTGEGDDDR